MFRCIRTVVAFVSSCAVSLAALAAPGDPDATFGVNGVQLIDFGGPTSVMVTAAAQQSTGKVIVVGQIMGATGRRQVAIGRLMSDGSPDSSFGNAGWAVLTDISYDLSPVAVAILYDNSIRVVGMAASHTFIGRMNAEGTNDGLNGVVVDFASNGERPRAATVLQDGYTVLVAGTCNAPLGSSGVACVVAYNSGGYRGGDGRYDVGGSRSEATAVLRIPNSAEFFLAGFVEDYSGDNRDMFVVRINSGSAIAPEFGVRIIDFGGRDEPSALVLRDNAHLIVAGSSTQGASSLVATASMRASDGMLDEFSWGLNGKSLTSVPYRGEPGVATVAAMFYSPGYLLPDSFYAIVTARSRTPAYPQPSGIVIVRFGRNGFPYQGFGDNGFAYVPNSAGDADYAVAGFELPGSQVLTVGSRTAGGTAISTRNDLDSGNLDTSLGNGGVASMQPYAPQQDSLTALTALPGGGYAGVRSGNNGQFTLFRARADGMLDTTFGGNGTVALEAGQYQIAAQPDGKILTTHEYIVPGTSRIAVALERRLANGQLDSSFGWEGRASIDNGNWVYGYGIAVQGDGAIVVALAVPIAGVGYRMGVTRVNSNGVPDSFPGVVVFAAPGDEEPRGVTVQPDGRILVGGVGTNGWKVYRILADGSTDPSWANGIAAVANGCQSQSSGNIALAPDGRVIVGGMAASGHPCVARFLPTGEPDESIGFQGVRVVPAAPGQAVSRIAVDADGRIVGALSSSIVRLLTDGGLDGTFAGGGFASIPNMPGVALWGLLRHDDERIVAYGSAANFGDYDVLLARFEGGGPAADTTPDVFAFNDLANVPPSTVIASNTVVITGMNAPAIISVTGGQYSIGCNGQFSSSPTTIGNGTPVCVRHTSAATAGTATNTTLTVGGTSDTFTTVTALVVDTTITSMPPNPSAGAGATFTFTSSDAAATIRFECAMDAGSFATCTSPALYSVPQGSHTFQVRAVSNAGPDATPATYTWFTDLSQPDTTITSGPSDPTPLASTSATFTFTSDETGVTFQCSFDTAPYTACASPRTYDNLVQGGHVFNVRAVDAAGNIDPTPARRIFTVDTTPPDTTITSNIPQFNNAATLAFTFTSNDPNAGFECRVDNGPLLACTSPASYSGFAEGNHSFFVRATDLAGNVDPTPASVFWTTDRTAPDTSIAGAPSGVTSSTTATVSITSSEAFSTFECSLDGAAFVSCTSPAAYSGLAEGAHTLAVRAIDRAGNADATPASATWTVDSVAPNTTITSAPSMLTSSQNASFTFVSNEAGATFECSLDVAAYVPCASPVTYTGLPDGIHTFAVRAVDAAGSRDPTPADSQWAIDSTAPDTVISSGPAPQTNATTATFTFQSEAGATFECGLDNASFTACTNPVTFTGLAEGSHRLTVRAVDAAGNVDASPSVFTWNIDTTGPDTTITSSPPAITNQVSTSFSFTGSESPVTFECRLDGGAYVGCTSPWHVDIANDGSHTFEVRARDATGNYDPSPAAWTWTVDTTPPVGIGLGYNVTNPTNSTSFTGTFFAPEPNVTFECRLDGAPYAVCTSPTTRTGLADGTHTFDVRAVDAAGNKNTPASVTWVVDTIAPDTTISGGPSGVVASNQATFTLGSTEFPVFDCRLDGAAFALCTSNPVTFTGLADGTHTFEARAKDFAGNVDATPASRTWTVDTTAPDTAIASGPGGTVASTAASFAFTSTESGGTFDCRLDGGAFASCSSPVSYAALSQGAHTFEVRARDAVGNLDASPASRTWVVDTVAPDTSILSGPSGSVSSVSATFTFSASEGGTTFQCRIDASAWGACLPDGITYVGGTQGSHTFEVRAVDAVGNADATPASRTWIIDTVAPDTSITGGPSGNNNTDTATFTFTATEAATFECKLDTGAFTACVSGVTYTGLAKGDHTFQVRARDAAGNVDASPATRAWRTNK